MRGRRRLGARDELDRPVIARQEARSIKQGRRKLAVIPPIGVMDRNTQRNPARPSARGPLQYPVAILDRGRDDHGVIDDGLPACESIGLKGFGRKLEITPEIEGNPAAGRRATVFDDFDRPFRNPDLSGTGTHRGGPSSIPVCRGSREADLRPAPGEARSPASALKVNPLRVASRRSRTKRALRALASRR